jgi:hypothetical protein
LVHCSYQCLKYQHISRSYLYQRSAVIGTKMLTTSYIVEFNSHSCRRNRNSSITTSATVAYRATNVQASQGVRYSDDPNSTVYRLRDDFALLVNTTNEQRHYCITVVMILVSSRCWLQNLLHIVLYNRTVVLVRFLNHLINLVVLRDIRLQSFGNGHSQLDQSIIETSE